MPNTIHYQLAIRDILDTEDEIVYSSLPSDALPYIAEDGIQSDGQSIEPTTGDYKIGAHTVDVIDVLSTPNPVWTKVDDWTVFPTNAEWDAEWTQLVGVDEETEEHVDTTGIGGVGYQDIGIVQFIEGGNNCSSFYKKIIGGLTPNTVHTVRITLTKGSGYNLINVPILKVGDSHYGAGVPNGEVHEYIVTATSDETGGIAIGIGHFGVHSGIFMNGNIYLSHDGFSIAEGDTGERIVTRELHDAGGQGHLLSRKAYLRFTEDMGATWNVLTGAFLNSIKLVNANKYRFTIGEARRKEDGITIFERIEADDRASCIMGGPVIGGFGPLPDFGACRVTIQAANTLGVVLGKVAGPISRYNQSEYKPLNDLLAQASPPFVWSNQWTKLPIDEANALARDYRQVTGALGSIGSTVLLGYFAMEVMVKSVADGSIIGYFQPYSSWEFSGTETTGLKNGGNLVSGIGVAIPWTGLGNDARGNAQVAQPAVGDQFDIYAYPVEISEKNPVHISGHPVDIVTGLKTRFGFSYNAGSAATLKALMGASLTVALRVKSSYKLKDFLEILYGLFGFATRTDESGDDYFISTRPALATVIPGIIDIDDLRDSDGEIWAVEEKTVINAVSIVQRKFTIWDKTYGDTRPIDALLESKYTANVKNGDETTYGTKQVTFDIPGSIYTNWAKVSWNRAVLGVTEVKDEWAVARAAEIFDQFGRGVETGELHLLRDSDNGAQIGDIITINCAHRPVGNQRGGQRRLQVVQRTPNAAGPDLVLWDAGSASQSALVPAFTLTANADDPTHVADVALTNAATLSAAGARVAVEWASGAAAPAAGVLLAYLLTPPDNLTSISTPPVARGSKIWVRMQARETGKAGGAWTGWQSITLGALAAPTGLAATILNAAQTRLNWNISVTDEQVQVLLRKVGEATFQPIAILDAGSVEFTLDNLEAGKDYQAGVRMWESATSFSATTTVTFTSGAAGTEPQLDPPYSPRAFAGSADPSGGSATIDGTFGMEVYAPQWPVNVVFEVAIETAVDSETPGTFEVVATVDAAQGTRTRWAGIAPNDKLKRYMRAKASWPGYLDSDYCDVVEVDPWQPTNIITDGADADLLLHTTNSGFPNGRVVTDSASIGWDWDSDPLQAKANLKDIEPSPAGEYGDQSKSLHVIVGNDGRIQAIEEVDIAVGGGGSGASGIGFTFGDGIVAPSTGAIDSRRLPYAALISRSDIWADAAGDAEVDIQTSPDGITWTSICAAALPTLAASQVAFDDTLTGWTLALPAGTWIRAVLNSISTCKQVSIELTVTKTGVATAIGFEFGDGIVGPSVGAIVGFRIPYDAIISRSDIWANVAGDAEIDIQTSTAGIAWTSICAAALPTLVASQVASDSTLTDWTLAIPAGTFIRAVVNSVATCKQINVQLQLAKS